MTGIKRTPVRLPGCFRHYREEAVSTNPCYSECEIWEQCKNETKPEVENK